MLRGTAYDAEIVGEKSYVLTHRNIQEIDLSKGDGQTYEDALTIVDPNLLYHSGFDLYRSEEGVWYLLNSQRHAVRLGCD